MSDWQDQYLPTEPRTAWRHWPLAVALLVSIGLAHAVAFKAIPQAAMDCAEYCEKEITK